MTKVRYVIAAVSLAWATSVSGSPTGVSVAINFGADEPNGAAQAFVEGAAGVAGTVNWNNTTGLADLLDDVVLDVGGTPTASGIEVEWTSNNTWSSDGRGEDNNNAPDGNDRNLMLGYLDTTDTSITEIRVNGLPAEIASGYDVFVYMLGGVLNRGGTYTLTGSGPAVSRDNVQTTAFDGTYIEGDEGNYLFFQGLTGTDLLLEAQATTPALFRAAVNGIEICAAGQCVPLPTAVAGRNNVGNQTVSSAQENLVFGPAGDPTPGLAQEWYSATNPGNKAAVDQIFDNNDPIVPVFQAGNGATWWTGNQPAFGELDQYPQEVQPTFNATDNNNYVVRATGELFVPESGSYRFADGVDDYTYLAIDLDKSGIAGDTPDEVLIDDNNWTDVYRTQNPMGDGWAETDINVSQDGEWLAVEFNMGEGGGGDAGVLYWDYNPNAPAGQRLGGAAGFPEAPEDPIDAGDAETMFVPDSHLRAIVPTLLSGDIVGSLVGAEFGFEFEIDGTTDTADQLVVPNPNSAIFTTHLDVDGVKLYLETTGTFQPGDSYQIIGADQITGVPLIIPRDAGQSWFFSAATGKVTFGVGLPGDYNRDGAVDVADVDLQSVAMTTPTQNLATFDENNDGTINDADRTIWVQQHAKTWYGDANFDGEFSSSDLVKVFIAGKYETGAAAGWADGDWNGDMTFSSSDLVAAFGDGGYEVGPRAATAAVPEPSSIVLLGVGLLVFARRRMAA